MDKKCKGDFNFINLTLKLYLADDTKSRRVSLRLKF